MHFFEEKVDPGMHRFKDNEIAAVEVKDFMKVRKSAILQVHIFENLFA